MRKMKLRKLIAFALAFALVLGVMPAGSAKAATKNKVLVWYGNSSVYTKDGQTTKLKSAYTDMSLTVDERDASSATFPADLSEYGLVWIWLPEVQLSSDATNALKNYVKAGGVVVLQGENSGYSPAQVSNPILSELAGTLGGNFSIANGSVVADTSEFNTSSNSDLLNGVSGTIACAAAADIEIGAGATWIAKATGSTGPTAHFIVGQQIGNGYLIGTSDMNWYDSERGNDASKKLLQNMQTLSVNSMSKVFSLSVDLSSVIDTGDTIKSATLYTNTHVNQTFTVSPVGELTLNPGMTYPYSAAKTLGVDSTKTKLVGEMKLADFGGCFVIVVRTMGNSEYVYAYNGTLAAADEGTVTGTAITTATTDASIAGTTVQDLLDLTYVRDGGWIKAQSIEKAELKDGQLTIVDIPKYDRSNRYDLHFVASDNGETAPEVHTTNRILWAKANYNNKYDGSTTSHTSDGFDVMISSNDAGIGTSSSSIMFTMEAELKNLTQYKNNGSPISEVYGERLNESTPYLWLRVTPCSTSEDQDAHWVCLGKYYSWDAACGVAPEVYLWTTGLTTGENTSSGSNNASNWGINTYNTVETIFNENGIAVEKVNGEDMASDLSSYGLVWIHLPAISSANYQDKINVPALKAFVAAGGRVVIQSEVSTMGNFFDGVEALAEELGGGFEIVDKNHDKSSDSLEGSFNSDSNLLGGASVDWNEEDVWIPTLNLTSDANSEWIAKQGDYIFIADQAAGSGRVTIMTDFNWYMNKSTDGREVDTGIDTVFSKLYLNSVANMNMVEDGGIVVNSLDELKAVIKNYGTFPVQIKLGANISGGFTVPENADVTLDLNGYTVNGTVENRSKLTVDDTSANGTGRIIGTQDGILNNTGATSLVVNGGTISGAHYAICEYVNTCESVINEGAVLAKGAYGTIGAYYSEGGSFTINDGVVITNVQDAADVGINTDDGASGDGLVAVTNWDAIKDFVVLDGKVVVGTVAAIGNKAYTSAQAAVNAAQTNETIKLYRDVEGTVTIPSGKNLIIDLDGHKINGAGDAGIVNNGTLLVKDSSEAQTGTVVGRYGITNNYALAVNGGTINGTGNDGIFNSTTATKLVVAGGVIRGNNLAICDYSSGIVGLSGCELECYGEGSGSGIGWVIGSYGSNKGGTYTIKPGVTMSNRNHANQFVHTNNGEATANQMVSVDKWNEIMVKTDDSGKKATVMVNTVPALSELEEQYKAGKKYIEELTDLTVETRTALLEKLDAAYAAAKTAVMDAADFAAAGEAKDLGIQKMELLLAQAEVMNEIAAKADAEKKKIDAMQNLSDTMKLAWKAQVDKAYSDAADALFAAKESELDGIKEDAFKTLENYGKLVADADVVALVNGKAEAADSIRKDAEDAKKAIDDMTYLSDARKAELKKAIDEAAKLAEDAIMAANSSADAQKALNSGIDAIAKIQADAKSENDELQKKAQAMETTAAKTGDGSSIALWGLVMIISLATVLFLDSKKKGIVE